MSEMVERVANAMQEKLESLTFSQGLADDKVQYREMARAAIAAMREPTEAMVDRGLSEPRGEMDWHKAVAVGWRAMIDEALK